MAIFCPFSYSIKILNIGTGQMATKRKTTKLRGGDILDVREYHDGRYGAQGMPRQKKRKPTKEDMQRVNAANKTRLCQLRMMQYIDPGDYFATLTYRVDARPPDMEMAVKHWECFRKRITRKYRRQQAPLLWFKNIEQGTKGAWHIHLVIKSMPEAVKVIEESWDHGGVYITQIRKSKYYSEDFAELATYMTKGAHTREKRSDGTWSKPRLRDASYSTSKNMPLPEPDTEKLVRWKKEVKTKKGYYITRIHEGINPATGFKYRRYTMIRLHRRI